MIFSSNYCLVELDKQDYCSVELDDKGAQHLVKNIMPHIGPTTYEIKIESIDQHFRAQMSIDAKFELETCSSWK